MKLWIDDIRNAPDESWSVARSVSSAIRFIAQFGEEITEISIDHDISHQVAMGERSSPYPCVETFAAVAFYMEKYYPVTIVPPGYRPHRVGSHSDDWGGDSDKPCDCDQKVYPKVTIHSSNRSGAKNIEYILSDFPDVTYKPYGPANRLEQTI